MRVAVTGTPGTGKTTATKLLEFEIEVVHLNDLIDSAKLTTGADEARGSLIADMDAIEAELADEDEVLIESHLAHHLNVDRVAVLRCHPDELKRRLLERGETRQKAEENAEAEALDVILSEAVDRHGLDAVYEIDTTEREPESIATEIESVYTGARPPSAGTVDFIEYL